MQTIDEDATLSSLEADDFDDVEDQDDEDDEEVGTDTIVMSDDDDDYSDPDISMEVNVDKLVEQFEKAEATDIHRRAEIRRRLEELAEKNSLEDTFAFDPDD